MLAALVLVLAGLIAPVVVAAPAEAATYRVCAPNGQCDESSTLCNPGQCGQSQTYRLQNAGEYCAPSVGCIWYQGANYFYNGGPRPTAAEQSRMTQCAANLGFVWLTGIAGGPVGFTIAGVSLALWGCS